MKFVRIICLALSLVLSVTLLSACSLTTTNSVSAAIDADGIFSYIVVRPDVCDPLVEKGAKDIRNAIKENYGCKINIFKDTVAAAEDNFYEILVGDTNREESVKAKQMLIDNRENNVFDFIVVVIGNKICIQATTATMVQTACDWFIHNFCKDIESFNRIRTDYCFIYQPEGANVMNTVSGVNLGKFTVVKPLRMSYLIGQQVESFIDFYEENGFVLNYIEDDLEEVANEILIGDTSREASKSVTVEGDNYVIKVVGNKLVIKGGNDLATWRGVKHFQDLLIEAGTTNPFNWTDGYVINGKYDAAEGGAYTLNFGDEFEGSTVDISKWGDYNYQAGRTAKSCLGGTNWYAGPMNVSTAYGKPLPHKNVYQADGSLRLATYKLNETDFVGTYASTFHSMLFKYGVWEIKAKMAVEPGCMSFWLNGTGEQNLVSRYGNIGRTCMTEVDLLENYGNEARFETAVHRWFEDFASDGITSTSGHISAATTAKYHTNDNNTVVSYDTERYGGTMHDEYNYFTLHWTDEFMNFAFNGKRYLSFTYDDEQSVSVHCLLNYINLHFRMGDASYGRKWDPEKHPEYSEVEIDYLRVYQTDAINSQMVYSSTEHVDPVKPTTIVYPEHPIKNSY